MRKYNLNCSLMTILFYSKRFILLYVCVYISSRYIYIYTLYVYMYIYYMYIYAIQSCIASSLNWEFSIEFSSEFCSNMIWSGAWIILLPHCIYRYRFLYPGDAGGLHGICLYLTFTLSNNVQLCNCIYTSYRMCSLVEAWCILYYSVWLVMCSHVLEQVLRNNELVLRNNELVLRNNVKVLRNTE